MRGFVQVGGHAFRYIQHNANTQTFQHLKELAPLHRFAAALNLAKEVFAEMFATSKDAAKIVDEKGLKQVTDTGAIEKIVDEVLKENPDKIAEYKSGKDKMFGFFVGQILKKSGGKANPAIVNDLLKAKLDQ